MKIFRFTAVIKGDPHIDAAMVEFPFDVEKEFGVKGRVKVQVTFDGYPYRGSLAKMGHPCHFIGLTKAVRQAIGKKPGNTVEVVLQQDAEPRVVEVPEDLAKLLKKNKPAQTFFDTLSFTNQKEYARWIIEAKKPETRQARLEKSLQMLSQQIKHP
jgi:hypothetical protein